MRRKRDEYGAEQEADMSKPCRCGTGFYCHRHLQYAVQDQLTPKLFKISKRSKKPKTGAKADSHGGQH